MKACLLITIFLMNSMVALAKDNREIQQALYKKHRALKHEEAKKWDKMKEDCRTKYPMWNKKTHPDYDAQFKCAEAVKDTEQEFNAKLELEICQNIPTLCRK